MVANVLALCERNNYRKRVKLERSMGIPLVN